MAHKKPAQLKDKDLDQAQGGGTYEPDQMLVVLGVKDNRPKPGQSSLIESMAEDESGN